MKFRHLLVFLLPTLLWTGCDIKDDQLHRVTKITDGDTFYIDEKEKIRFIGIDAPESRNTGRRKKGYYGKEAKEHLKEYLLGKNVRLEYDITRTDRYNRTLAYVYLEDGTFVNAELVKQGYAMVYTVPPNVKYADLFLEMQRDARENKLGLWGRD